MKYYVSCSIPEGNIMLKIRADNERIARFRVKTMTNHNAIDIITISTIRPKRIIDSVFNQFGCSQVYA